MYLEGEFVMSPSLNLLVSFDGADGDLPASDLIIDAAGDLFGTTIVGGANGDGTVFEIDPPTGALTTLASFDGADGSVPIGGVISDAAGDLFGTTLGGGADGAGTVFEIVKSTGALITLASFNGADGADPIGGLISDAAGDLFGTTEAGGAGGGAVFEIVKSTGALITLASFNGANGALPVGGLIRDAAGDLFGTTEEGGAYGDGTVFEIDKATGALITLASFDGADGAAPIGGLISDAAGDLFGTTDQSGAYGDGTVFEIDKATGALITLTSFNGANGANPQSALISNSEGDLFGTTYSGGSYDYGTVFEIVKSTGALITLVNFDGANGEGPVGGLTTDAAGDLFGTTEEGGANGDGAAFEITNSGFIVDPGPKVGAVSATVDYGANIDLTSLILAAATPGIPGDTLTITADGANFALGAVSLVNGDLVYSATTAALSDIPANGTEADSFTYTITDTYGETATGTVKITVANPATVIQGSPYGYSTIRGTSHADIIDAYGYYNTIYDNGGNDLVNAGGGYATVYAGAGDVVVLLNGYHNVVSGGDGNDRVSGSAGNLSVTLGNGADSVSTDGFDNTITLGSGEDVVDAGAGNSTVSLGGGNDSVTIGGFSNIVTAGNGSDTITGGEGVETITLGNGNDHITTSGASNAITVGTGTNTIVAGGGEGKVVVGAGVDAITLSGNENSVTLNGAKATVVSGGEYDDTVVANGGEDTLTFHSWNSVATLNGVVTADIADLGGRLRIDIGSSTQMDAITGFGDADSNAILDLQHGAGGYGSAAAAFAALRSDGRGGTMLSLGGTYSIDFVGTTLSQLHASNFVVG
jgi:uncharacterized repeat protein (TIGR03803 family)